MKGPKRSYKVIITLFITITSVKNSTGYVLSGQWLDTTRRKLEFNVRWGVGKQYGGFQGTAVIQTVTGMLRHQGGALKTNHTYKTKIIMVAV